MSARGDSTDGLIIKTFLGMPMHQRGEQVANCFLDEKKTAPEFTAEDEEVLAVFVSRAVAATANARTYRDARAWKL